MPQTKDPGGKFFHWIPSSETRTQIFVSHFLFCGLIYLLAVTDTRKQLSLGLREISVKSKTSGLAGPQEATWLDATARVLLCIKSRGGAAAQVLGRTKHK